MNSIEQEFFDVFEIKKFCNHPIEFDKCSANACSACNCYVYPKITDRVLLELICIGYSAHDIDLTIDEIKENVLKELIENKSQIKQQIQSLFER